MMENLQKHVEGTGAGGEERKEKEIWRPADAWTSGKTLGVLVGYKTEWG